MVEDSNPQWLIERGIGESRAALIDGDEVVEARVYLEGVVRAGTRLAATLKQVGPPVVAIADGQEYLLPQGAPGITEGAELAIEVSREAIPGGEPWKRPLARLTEDGPGAPPPIEARVLRFPAPADRLGEAGWCDLIDQARSGVVQFAGGELRISPTPAMTLIDVDGYLPAEELAVRGAAEAAKAIRRLDIGGSIGIDLPTSGNKAARQAAAAAIEEHLPQPFERTAVNGFGFLQVVRPRRHASLFELAADRAGFEARAILRRAGREVGAVTLVAHPAVLAALQPGWTDRLATQIGGAVTLRAEPGLAMSAAYAHRL